MRESDIKVGASYIGNGWSTIRKVEAIEKEPGRFGETYVLYSRVNGRKGQLRKTLAHFAFEAIREVN